MSYDSFSDTAAEPEEVCWAAGAREGSVGFSLSLSLEFSFFLLRELHSGVLEHLQQLARCHAGIGLWHSVHVQVRKLCLDLLAGTGHHPHCEDVLGRFVYHLRKLALHNTRHDSAGAARGTDLRDDTGITDLGETDPAGATAGEDRTVPTAARSNDLFCVLQNA